ncbi:uncharacterized protein LOC127838603 isoform X1 [Dreissena polymorpha]|nr:uncharacterized protein LOC127838603 isoform X1 [Dreissena polymorpha]
MKINCALFLVFAVASNAQLRPPRPPPGNGDPLSRNPPIAPNPVPVPMTVEAEVVEANEVKSIDQVSPTQIVVSQLPSFPSPQPGVTVPRPDGCSPGCGANEICAKLGDSYCRMGQACSVCIRMDSIRIPTPALAAIFSSQKAVSHSPSPSSEPTISPFDLYGTVSFQGVDGRSFVREVPRDTIFKPVADASGTITGRVEKYVRGDASTYSSAFGQNGGDPAIYGGDPSARGSNTGQYGSELDKYGGEVYNSAYSPSSGDTAMNGGNPSQYGGGSSLRGSNARQNGWDPSAYVAENAKHGGGQTSYGSDTGQYSGDPVANGAENGPYAAPSKGYPSDPQIRDRGSLTVGGEFGPVSSSVGVEEMGYVRGTSLIERMTGSQSSLSPMSSSEPGLEYSVAQQQQQRQRNDELKQKLVALQNLMRQNKSLSGVSNSLHDSIIATAQKVASQTSQDLPSILQPKDSGHWPQEYVPEPIGLTGGNNRQANKQSNLLSKLERIRQKSTASQLPSDIQMERYLQRLATADTSAGTLKAVDTSTASGFNPGQANLGQLNLGQPNVVDYTSWLQFQQMKQTQNNTNGTADLTNGNINELWLQFNNFVKQKNQPGTVAGSTSGVNPSVLAVNTQTYVPTQQPAVNSDPFFGDMFGPSSTNSLYPMWPMFDMPLFGFGFF